MHIGATIWFAALVVRDALYPEYDIARTDGVAADRDDPGGGVLDRSPDRLPWSKVPGVRT